MRARWIAGVVAAGALGLGAVAGGCMIVTGSTDGYSLGDSGAPEASTVDGSCPADGGVCISLECASAAECTGSTEAAPQVCCLGFVNATTIGATCQANGCQLGVQACATNAECPGSSCILQQCPGFDPITFKACGLVPTCAAVGSRPADAGPSPDAAPSDANAPDASIPDAQLDGPG